MHGQSVAAAIVLAGGSGTRVGAGRNKTYLPLAGRSVISFSLATFAAVAGIGPVVLVVRAEDRDLADAVLRDEGHRGVEVVTGGATRQDSELAGLRHLAARIDDGSIDTVLVHDGARPLVGGALVAEVLRVARHCGGAVPALPRGDLATAAEGTGLAGPAPAGLVAVQTPQGFRAGPLLAAYEEADRMGFTGTDTAACMARFAADVEVASVLGEHRNLKITYAHDLALAAEVIARGGATPG